MLQLTLVSRSVGNVGCHLEGILQFKLSLSANCGFLASAPNQADVAGDPSHFKMSVQQRKGDNKVDNMEEEAESNPSVEVGEPPKSDAVQPLKEEVTDVSTEPSKQDSTVSLISCSPSSYLCSFLS